MTSRIKPDSSTKAGPCGVVPPVSHYPSNSKRNDVSAAIASIEMWRLRRADFDTTTWQRKITYSFVKTRGWSNDKESAVSHVIDGDEAAKGGFETWEHFANIKFVKIGDPKSANIRVGFEPGASWSAIGRGSEALDRNKPSLNLGWLKSNPVPDEDDRATILHEFGHALGLMHEHQSPARGQFIHLKEIEVYRYYEPLLGSRAQVKSQVIDTYNMSKIMNMSTFDMHSIMMYFMPGHLNEEGIDIPVNRKLSELDKAFIMLNYPPNLTNPAKLKAFIRALIVAGVTDKAAGEILRAWYNSKEDIPLASTNAREQFSEFNKSTSHLHKANRQLVNAVDPESLTQFGIRGFLGNVIDDKLFKSFVKVSVENTLKWPGVSLRISTPGTSRPEVMRMIGGLALHPLVAEHVNAIDKSLRLEKATSPDHRVNELTKEVKELKSQLENAIMARRNI